MSMTQMWATPTPPYETGPAAGIRRNARYGVATRVPGVGAVVMEGYPSELEARRARSRHMRRGEFVSPILERVSTRAWIPLNPRLRVGYAVTPALV